MGGVGGWWWGEVIVEVVVIGGGWCVGAWVRWCVGAWVGGCVGEWVRGWVGGWVARQLTDLPSITRRKDRAPIMILQEWRQDDGDAAPTWHQILMVKIEKFPTEAASAAWLGEIGEQYGRGILSRDGLYPARDKKLKQQISVLSCEKF